VRCRKYGRQRRFAGALTAVIRKMAEAPGTFDEKGWLQIGFLWSQLALAENYIPPAVCIYAQPVCCAGDCQRAMQFWSDPACALGLRKRFGRVKHCPPTMPHDVRTVECQR